MSLLWKLVLIIKMSTSQDFKTIFKYNLTSIFLSLRAQSKKPLCTRTPCIYLEGKLVSSNDIQLIFALLDFWTFWWPWHQKARNISRFYQWYDGDYQTTGQNIWTKSNFQKKTLNDEKSNAMLAESRSLSLIVSEYI